jgi:hypothetical protein
VPKYNVWIRKDNEPKWLAMPKDKRSDWLNKRLEREQAPLLILDVETNKITPIKEWWED